MNQIYLKHLELDLKEGDQNQSGQKQLAKSMDVLKESNTLPNKKVTEYSTDVIEQLKIVSIITSKVLPDDKSRHYIVAFFEMTKVISSLR